MTRLTQTKDEIRLEASGNPLRSIPKTTVNLSKTRLPKNAGFRQIT